MGKKKKQEKREKLEKQEQLEKIEKKSKAVKQEKADKQSKLEKQGKTGKQDKSEKKKKSKDKEEKLLIKKREPKYNTAGKTKQPEQLKEAERSEQVQQSEQEQQVQQAEQIKQTQQEKNSPKACEAVLAKAELAAIFRIFGDESRLRILELLKGTELCAGDLLKSMNIAQSTLSHHMKALTEAGIVKCRKQGKWSYYSIDRDKLTAVSDSIMKWS